MGAIDGPPSEIGEKVAAALIGTFLGIFLAYGFVLPLATNLEHRVADDAHYAQCIKMALLSAYRGLPPAIAVEFARRVLPGDVRPTFDQTEKACKGQRPGSGRRGMSHVQGARHHHPQEAPGPRRPPRRAPGRWPTPIS